MEIRDASEGDIEILMKMQLRLFSKWHAIDPVDQIDKAWFGSTEHIDHIKRSLGSDERRILIVTDDCACIGYLKAKILIREPFLQRVGLIAEAFVCDEYRAKGAGSRLLSEAIDWFRQENLEWTTVSTHALDKEAISFWLDKGYEEHNKEFKMRIR